MKKLILILLLLIGVKSYAQFDSLTLNKNNIYLVMNDLNIKHQDIVYKQIILETGNLKSKLCIRNHNLLGIKHKRRYKKYTHWSESLIDYKNKIQYKYKSGNYYNFLKKIKYAKDKRYIYKLKRLNHGI